MITQKEIARELGVTQQSVSHALTGGGSLSPATRERIVMAAREFGYRPNSSARAMKSGRFGSVALLLGNESRSSALPSALWGGIHRELAECNLNLMLTRLPDDELNDRAVLPKILRELSVDGVLIDYTHHIPPRLRDALDASGLPAVWLNVKRESDCVHPDDFGAGETLGNHLIASGHRRIVYVDATRDWSQPDLHYSVHDRLAGVQSAGKNAGIEVETLSLAHLSIPEKLAALRALWEREAPVTALVGYDPLVFELACRAAWESGRRVPDDMSVAVFSEPYEALCLGFDMTRMEIPQKVEGQQAVKLLMKKIGGTHRQAPPQQVPFELIAGETVAAPKVG